MQFLNYLARLVYVEQKESENAFESTEKITVSQGSNKNKDKPYPQSKTSLQKQFFKQMTDLFRKVEDEEEVLRMNGYNLKQEHRSDLVNAEKVKEETNNNKLNKSESQKQEYRDKVREYTRSLIGEKIKEAKELFDSYEIDSGNLRLNSPAIMRIVTKWCEQLEKYFDPKEIVDREHPFRMQNGEQGFLTKKEMRYLNYLLQKQKK